MAELGLFADPQQLREAVLMQQAKMTPQETINYMALKGGQGLGEAIGGMFGVNVQDPAVARAIKLRELGAKYGTTTAEALDKIAADLQQTDPQMAMQVAQKANDLRISSAKLQSEQALTSQRMREKAAADPLQQLLRTGKYTTPSMAKYAKSGNIEDLEPVDKADPTALSETKDGIFLINKNTGDVIRRIGDAPERGTKVNVTPEIKMAPDIVGAVNAADKATEKEVAMLDSAKLAKQLINETAKTNNSQAWEAARTTIAKAVGENKLSNEDIRRTGVDPRLVQGALDWVNKKIQGVPNPDIQRQLYVLGSVLENNASARYDAKISRFRGAAEASKFPGQPSTYFPTAAERSQASQPKVVDWSELAPSSK